MQTKEAFSYIGVAAIAGAVGAVVGVLIAPASGFETRRRLARRIDEERDAMLYKGQRAAERAADFVQDRIEDTKRKLAVHG